MASITQNAVGTQRQFTKQPVATYQKSLRNLTASQGIVNTGAGDRLYNALTGLGSNIMKYASSEEDRARARTVEVEPLINAATEDDWKKLSAIELLNKYGQFQLADNPYAVAAIEQARGKYMSEKFSQQYQITMAQDPVKDPEQERQRYDEEKRKFLEENKNESYDVQQFYKGFWESNPQDLLNITNQKVAEKSKSLETMGKAYIQAQASTYVRENADKSPEEFQKGLQEIINNSTLMSQQLDVRKAFMEGILGDIAQVAGSPDKIKQCANLIITNNEDGTKPVHVGDVIDLNTYLKMAEDTALARPNQWMNQQYEAMINCDSVDALDKWYNELPKDAQHLMNPKYGQYRMTLLREKKEEAKAKIRANQQRLKATGKSQNADIALTRYLTGRSSMTYCSAEDAYNAAATKISTLKQGDMKTFTKILLWAPNSRMRSEYKNYLQNSILGSSADEMNDSSDFKSFTNAIDMYEYNPALFEANFGKELGSDMQAIRALIDFKGGSNIDGFKMFCEGRDNMARSDAVKQAAEDFASTAMSNGYGVELTDLSSEDANGNYSTTTVPITADAFSNVNATALKYLRACTQDDGAASTLLQSMLNKNYVVYDSHPMPKAVFAKKTDATNGIDASSDQMGAATRVMDEKVKAANAENPGMKATWWWGVDDKMHFGDPNWGFDEGNGYTLDEFYDLVNQWWYDRQAEEEAAAEEVESSDDSSSDNDSSSDDSSDDSGSNYSYTTDDGGVVTETGNGRATYSDWSWHGY